MGRVRQVTAYLADTHVLIWALDGSKELAAEHVAILNSDAVVFVSIASLWEIAIKTALGKLEAPPKLNDQIEKAGFSILPIELAHIDALKDLPLHHRDPFDRLLIAQARTAGLTILTADRQFERYAVDIA